MVSTYPQVSDWSINESSNLQRQCSLNKTCGNNVDLSNTDSIHDKQRNNNNNYEMKRREFSCMLPKCCSCMSPFLQGLILGALISGLILAIVISLWLTSTITTTQAKKSDTSALSTYSVITTSNTITGSLTNASSSTTTGIASTSSSTTTGSASTGSSTTTSLVSTSYSTTIGSTSARTVTTTGPASTSTTAATTASTTPAPTTITTTITTAYNYCSNLRCNQTGVIVAGTSSQGSAPNQLRNPSCLYIDENNALYICDQNNNRIQKWMQGAASGTTVAGSSAGTQGTTSTLLNRPMDLTFDKNGYMYVVDYFNNRIQRFVLNSTNGTTVAGTTTHTVALTDLNQPTAIDVDNNSNIYILDMNNRRVVEWAPNATSGTVLISDNRLYNNYDILLSPDSLNQVYISDRDDHVVYLWTFGSSNPDITLSVVNDTIYNSLNNPMGITLDPYGNLYVADTSNNRVVMFCANSTVGIVVAGITSTTPSISHATAIAFDSNLNLYVLSQNNAQVVQFSRI